MDALTSSNATFCYTSMSSPVNIHSLEARSLLGELCLLQERLGQASVALALFVFPEDAQRREHLRQIIHASILSCDSLMALDTVHHALVLPGATVFKAQALVEEMLKTANGLVQAVGIAAGAEKNTDINANLLHQATQAMQDALKSQAAVRVYRATAHPLSERKTLVHSNEKRFLFSGGE